MNYPARFASLSLVVFLASCNDQGIIPLYSTTEFCSTDASSINEIHLELEANNISHSYDPIKNCVNSIRDIDAYLPEYDDEPSTVSQPPEGLQPGISTSWGERNNELIAILEASDIEFGIIEYEEIEFITWKEKDVEVVESLLELPEWQREMFREMRAESQITVPNH